MSGASKLTRSSKLTLVINPAGDFTLAPTAATATVKRGSSATAYLSLNALAGFYSPVAFTASGLPAGTSAGWNKSSLLVYGTSTTSNSVKLAATTSTLPGSYTITLTATAGPTRHTVPLTVVVV